MHPVLFTIPFSWVTLALLMTVFGVGGLLRGRFKPAERDSSYLWHLLGLNIRWGDVANPWSKALVTGLVQGGVAAAVGYGIFLVTRSVSPGLEGLPLHIYGVMMATAFIVGISLLAHQARREQLPPVLLRDAKDRPLRGRDGKPQSVSSADLVTDLAFYLLFAGLVGSRVLYIITRWEAEYAANPIRVFKITEGGLVWYGGFIGALLVAFWFIRRHKVSFLPYADILIPSVALGHGIGRLGCFAAGCCYGNVAHEGFPLTVQFPAGSPAFHDHSSAGLLGFGAEHSLPVYPTQLFEAGGETLIFFALLFIRSRKRFHGQVLLSYLFLYPLLRTVIEMFRGDAIRGFLFRWPTEEAPMLLSTSQAVSIGVALTGIALTIAILRQKSRAAASAADSDTAAASAS